MPKKLVGIVYNGDMNEKESLKYDVIVVGGGASGLFFAAGAGASCRGLILEKTDKVGTKLMMSGGGRCNITHDGSIKDFVNCYGDAGPAIRKILYRHDNSELRAFFKSRGVNTRVEDDGRVFPTGAKDVLHALLTGARENGFEIKTGQNVVSIRENNEKGDAGEWILSTKEKDYRSDRIVIATGGASYPRTGSDGSMFYILERDLGLEVVEPRPALYPIEIENYPYKELAGISIKGRLSGVNLQKKKALVGDILFTQWGFSGPAAINISGDLREGEVLIVNYIYPIVYKEALNIIMQGVQNTKKSLSTLVSDSFGLPKRLGEKLVLRCHGSTKKLAKLLTEDEFKVKSGSFHTAMVTRGGVALGEINTKTMELKSKKGIFVIGEALNVDGYTGGYNLQFAYSSAMIAAEDIIPNLGSPVV